MGQKLKKLKPVSGAAKPVKPKKPEVKPIKKPAAPAKREAAVMSAGSGYLNNKCSEHLLSSTYSI